MLLVGNKLDLDEFEEREVSTQTGQDFAKVGLTVTAELIYCVCVCVPQLYGTEFIEASAKTGQNVGNALMILVRLAQHGLKHVKRACNK